MIILYHKLCNQNDVFDVNLFNAIYIVNEYKKATSFEIQHIHFHIDVFIS